MGPMNAVTTIFAYVALLCAHAHATYAQTPVAVAGQYGQPVALQAGAPYVVTYGNGLSFAGTASTAATITVTVISAASGAGSSLPSGYAPTSYGSAPASGYTVVVSPSYATLANAYLTAVVKQAAAAGASYGALTPYGGGYQAVSGVSYNAAASTVTIPVAAAAYQATGSASYIAVAAQQQINSGYGQPVDLCGNSQQVVTYGSGGSGYGSVLSYQSPYPNTITAYQQTTPYAGTGESALVGAGNSISSYYSYAMKSGSGSGYVSYAYTQKQLDDHGVCDANNLRVAVYNEAGGYYRVPPSGYSVDTDKQYIKQSYSYTGGSLPHHCLVEAPYRPGHEVHVKKAQHCRVSYTNGAHYRADVDDETKVTCNAIGSYKDATGGQPLPPGYTALAFQGEGGSTNGYGSGCGYHLRSEGGRHRNSHLYSAPVTKDCDAALEKVHAEGHEAECLHYDSDHKYLGSLGRVHYAKDTHCVKIPVPSCSAAGDHYVFAYHS